MPINKVLVVDEHALFRQGVCKTLGNDTTMEIVGQAGDEQDALAQARQLKPDLVLIDINGGHCGGPDAVGAIKCTLPDAKIVILGTHYQDELFFEAIKRGAEGFLNKGVHANVLLDTLKGMMTDQKYRQSERGQ